MSLDLDEKLTAVLICDSFTCAFWPVTQEIPKVLMPVCSIPLLEYSLELLARSKVDEVVVFCTVHHAQVRDYLFQHKTHKLRIKCVSKPSCKNTGDVLRYFAANPALLSSDFILLYGDSVGNCDLQEAVQLHKARRVKSKDYIVTKLFHEVPVTSQMRSKHDQSTVVLDGSRILQYESHKRRQFELNSNFKGTNPIEVRSDLMDCNIDICAPEVLGFFAESFDYQTINDHLIKDIICSELQTEKFAAYILPKHQYFARVYNPRIYDLVSRDILNRWTFPVVIDDPILQPGESSFRCMRNNFYREDNCKVAYSAVLTPPLSLGSGTVIGENAVISGCVIGRNCRIGANVALTRCYLWDGVVLEDNVQATHSIMCSGVSVGARSVVNKGAVLSLGVRISEDVIVPEFTRLAKVEDEETDYGNCWEVTGPPQEQRASESATEGGDYNEYISESIGGSMLWEDEDESGSDLNSDSSSIHSDIMFDEKGNKISVSEGKNIALERFIEEVKTIVREKVESNEDAEVMQIEINSLKFSDNRSIENCISGIVEGLVSAASSPLEVFFTNWASILERYVHTEPECLHTLKEFERTVVGSPHANAFPIIVKALYYAEVLDEQHITAWHSQTSNSDLKASMQPFIDWLLQED